MRANPLGRFRRRHPGAGRGGHAAERILRQQRDAGDRGRIGHLTHFYLSFVPDLAEASDEEPAARRFLPLAGGSFARALREREGILGVLGLFAGKWPNSLAIQPGGTTRPVEAGDPGGPTGC